MLKRRNIDSTTEIPNTMSGPKILGLTAELIRDGACKLIAQDLDIEVSELLSALCGRRVEQTLYINANASHGDERAECRSGHL